MIRPASLSDVAAVAVLGERFHEEAGLGDIASYSHADTRATLAGMVESPDAILIVAEKDGEIVGMAGALTFPFYFNAGHRTAQELFWYVKSDARDGTGRELIDALEATAREMGCESLIMIALENISPEVTGRYYRSRGYRAAEHSWIRRL